ncbi:MAG: hypothetical protein ACHQUA_02670, partial [Microgenomates group bacterium]
VEKYKEAIVSAIPQSILDEANIIVSEHRPTTQILDTEPTCMALNAVDYHDIARPYYGYPGGREGKDKKIAELREEYREDHVAQQQLDAQDPFSLYHIKLREFGEALQSGNTPKASEIEEWVKTNYPDIS